MTTTASLGLGEGTELASALVARIADDLGIRLLAIKGRVSDAHGLRPPRASVDVDVLVEPSRHGELVAALMALGWSEAPPPPVPQLFGTHSVTLGHPSWPCELDVHDRFPGFLANPADVFDELWAGRSSISAAGLAVPATGLHGSALLSALHALRSPDDPRNAAELAALVNRLSARSVDEDRLRSLAVATGALATAEPLLSALGIESASCPDDDRELARWALRQSVRETRNVGWLVAIRRSPLRHWPHILVKVVFADERYLRRYYPDAPPGRRGLWVARWWRLRLAVRDLPKALRVAARLR